MTQPVGIRNPFTQVQPQLANSQAQVIPARAEHGEGTHESDVYTPTAAPPALRLRPMTRSQTRGLLSRLALSLTLAASVTGVVAPLVHDAMQQSVIDARVQVMNDGLHRIPSNQNLPPVRMPAPDVTPSDKGAQMSPDGHLLLSATQGDMVLTSVDSGRQVTSLPASRGETAWFLADSQLLTYAGQNFELRDTHTGNVVSKLELGGWRNAVPAPAGGRIAIAAPQALYVVGARDGQLTQKGFRLREGDMQVQSWSADGRRFVALGGSYDTPHVIVMDAEDGNVVFDQTLNVPANQLQLSRDGKLLAVGGHTSNTRWDNQAALYDIRSGTQMWSRRGFDTVRFSPTSDDVLLAYSPEYDSTGSLERVDAHSGKTEWSAATSPNNRSSVDFAPDGSRVIVQGEDALQVFNADNGQFVWEDGDLNRGSVVVSNTGKWLAVSDQGEHTTVQRTSDGAIVTQFEESGQSATPPQFSKDDGRLLTIDSSGYYDYHLSVVDMQHSPLTAQQIHARQADTVRLIDGMLVGNLTDAQRAAIHGQMDGMSNAVVRVLADSGTRITVLGEKQTPATLFPSVSVQTLFANPAAQRAVVDAAFAKADASYGKAIAEAKQRLSSAIANMSNDNRYEQPAASVMHSNPAYLNDDVRRAAANVAGVQGQRAQAVWNELLAAGLGNVLEPLTAPSGDAAVTLESIARAHGARNADEIAQFTDLMQTLNGSRLERAQANYLSALHSANPELPLKDVPLSQRPFAATDDIVAPSYYLQDGKVIGGANVSMLKAWSTQKQPAGLVTQADGSSLITLSPAALAGTGDNTSLLRQQLGRVYEAALSHRDADFYQRMESNLRNTQGDPHANFAVTFSYLSTGQDSNSYVVGDVRSAIDAATRAPLR